MKYAPHTGRIPGCKNFFWEEATRNGARPVQESSWNGRVVPASEVEDNIINVATWLQRFRNELERRSKGERSVTVHVTSWFRPPAVNRAVGGAYASYHLRGDAVDFYLTQWQPEEVIDALFDIKFPGGIGVSVSDNNGWFIHVDLGKPRAWNYNSSPRSRRLLQYVKEKLGQW